MELTKVFTAEQFAQGLESWDWIGLDGKEPVLASLFGDVLLRAPDGFWWLDTLEGTLNRPWKDAEAVRADLNTTQGQDRYLLAGLAYAARGRGLDLTADQIYDFQHPLVLGGEPTADNLVAIDFVVAVNVAGQIHDQVRDLPPGTPISEITIA